MGKDGIYKQWYGSKTLWFNVLTLIVAIAASFGFAEFQPEPEVLAIASGIVAVINLVLRMFFTDKGLLFKK